MKIYPHCSNSLG